MNHHDQTHLDSTRFDAIVIGTGIAGIYMLHKLKNELGFTVRAFEKGGGVGGTWFWNRYPGARSDTESSVYRYSFDQETYPDWKWHRRYTDQSDMSAYLNAIVDRHHLREHIQFNTAIVSAIFDEETAEWAVETANGVVFHSRYLVTAIGVLSKRNIPEFKGTETFKGLQVHTGAWPEGLSLAGKRVGIIGTGSTGVQFIPAAAREAAHLTVFQRSAQYCVPAGENRMSEEFVDVYRANFQSYWQGIRGSRIACGFEESAVPAMSVATEERQRIFQQAWDAGNGFRFMFGTFSDIAIDPAANEAAASFICGKIREIVKDPETAKKLCPTELYAKRPVCADGYYETFNRDNVSLVDLKTNAIREFTPAGVVTEDGIEHPLDVLAFATGFECVEGSYLEMNIRGRSGEALRDHWKEEPTSYLGITVHGFPNLFMVLGPNSAFSNLPPSIETQVEWIAELIGHAEREGIATVETTVEAEAGWTETCKQIAAYTLFPQVKSWIFGANLPGRPNRVLFYFGGLAGYRETLDNIRVNGFAGYQLPTKASKHVAEEEAAT
ncbi:NAD(P)/FAD-dependent oxidoreductase [Dyella sp. GSA-30]|uniref:flavin-containing monooxygenase n=1 Tax=Dyella sp. GSA-30 TaxID=2994496 RepID=UPI002491F41B|nr:NAD(P)/FAD-dependent oxidoreductase [Dyella sp. GSA-30]